MKIAFIASRYHINQHHWMTALQGVGHEVRFYCSHSEPTQEHYAALTPYVVPQRLRPAWQRWLLRVAQTLRGHQARDQFDYQIDRVWLQADLLDFQPEVIIVRDLFFPLSLAGFAIARQLNIPHIHYNQYPLELPETLPTRLAKTLRIAPRCRITPSRTTNTEQNPNTNSWYVPLITDTQPRRHDYQPDGVLRLLFVGKYKSRRKNHLLLLEALHQTVQTNPVHLTMVGSDSQTDPDYFTAITTYITDHNLTQHVNLLVDVPHADMIKLYQSADVFVLPSHNEPYAISPIEAMSHGLSVILTESNGGRFIVKPDKTGYLVKDHNVQELAAIITKLATAHTRAQTLGQTAQKEQQLHYAAKAFVPRLEKVVQTVTQKTH